MMTWAEYEDVPIGIFIPGNIFGDLEVYKNSKRLFMCTAMSRVETFCMKKKDFRRILFIRYPILGKIYLNIMDFKLLELEKVMQIIVNAIFDGEFVEECF
jgi:CRP-like cAMP-binding protein